MLYIVSFKSQYFYSDTAEYSTENPIHRTVSAEIVSCVGIMKNDRWWLFSTQKKKCPVVRFGSPETSLAKEQSFAKLRTGTYLVAFNAILVPDRSLSIISLENKTNPDMHSECGPIQRILITDSI